MLQRLFILLCLSLFLTACASDSSDDADAKKADIEGVDDINSITSTFADGVAVVTTTGAPFKQELSYDMFDEVIAYIEDNEDGVLSQTLVLRSDLAVEIKTDVTGTRSAIDVGWDINETITTSKFSASAASIKYDTYDDTYYTSSYISDVTLDIGDKSHTIKVADGYANNIGFYSEFGEDGYLQGGQDFYNGDNGFNFGSNYMVYIEWHTWNRLSKDKTDDSLNEYDGYMVAGFETDGNNIPIAGTNVRFKGNGEGYYVIAGETDNTNFNFFADVDFTTYDVALTINKTEGYPCTADGNCYKARVPDLDFTASLSYTPNINNISGTVAVDGMNGTVDARFYGRNDDKAEELGGTFSMASSSASYVGYFGGVQSDIFDGATVITPSPDSKSHGGHASLTAASQAANTNEIAETLTLTGLAVLDSQDANYERPNTNTPWDKNAHYQYTNGSVTIINSPSIAITFDENGYIAKADIVVPYAKYIATLATGVTGSATEFEAEKFDVGSDNIDFENYMAIGRGPTSYSDSSFSFDSDYMLAIYWSAEANQFDQYDNEYEYADLETRQYYMIAGIETAGGAIPTSGTATFKGVGDGIYHNKTPEFSYIYYPEFNATAIVDFATYTVGLTAADTKHCSNEGCIDSDDLSHLDFTANLSYATQTNDISGAVHTDDGMKGTIDARFYGPAAEELGGRFYMQNTETEYYLGIFSAKKP